MVGQNWTIPSPLECHSLSPRCLAIPRTPVPSPVTLLLGFCSEPSAHRISRGSFCVWWEWSHQGLPPILKFLLLPSPRILNFNSLFDHQVTAWQHPGRPSLPLVGTFPAELRTRGVNNTEEGRKLSCHRHFCS